MSLIQTGRPPYLFHDAVEPVTDPLDKLVAAGVRAIAGIEATDLDVVFIDPRVSPITRARRKGKWWGVREALRQYRGLRIASFAELFEARTGTPLELGRGRTREAVRTTDFAELLANIVQVIVLVYRVRPVRGQWSIAAPGRAHSFRDIQLVALGGYPDVPIVAEGADIPEAPLTAEQAVTAKVAKHIWLMPVTLELLKANNMLGLQQMLAGITDAFDRTEARSVWDLFVNNGPSPDGDWFSVAHGNTSAAPLSAAAVNTMMTGILTRPRLGTTEMPALPITPGTFWLVCSLEQWEVACGINQALGDSLFHRFGERDEFILASPFLPSGMWGLYVDARIWPSIQVLYLDGVEEPQVSLADTKEAGQLFSHDRLVYRIGSTYGPAIVEWRAAARSTGA